jgi:hypothetical protein
VKRDETECDPGRFFEALEQRAAGEPAPDEPSPRPEDDPMVHELVRAFLMWDAPRAGVGAGLARLRSGVVDYNELRVCLPGELTALLGARYPNGGERCLRLRAALNEIFRRENGLVLAQLKDEPKRAARAYLDSLPGMVGFVAARVALVGCEAHAFPVDRTLLALLEAGGAVEPGLDPDAASSRLERAVRAGEALLCYRRLEMMALEPTADEGRAARGSPRAGAARAGSGKKAGKV